MRWAILAHRYVGIAIGWLLLAWCLSGFVMMYQPYPSFSLSEKLRTLPVLGFSACCAWQRADEVLAGSQFDAFVIEMLLGQPMIRIESGFGSEFTLNLATGEPLDVIDAEQALQIARSQAKRVEPGAEAAYLASVDVDQWTVGGGFGLDRPLHRIALNDADGTEWYISSTTGSIVQQTTRSERIWNWLGAVPHWTYPTILRRNGPLWVDVIIWTTIVGTFMTVIGLYIGIKRLRRDRSGRWSPYRGINYWHHYFGLIFGLITLTWIVSGLFSVSPWGLFDSSSSRPDRDRLQAYQLEWQPVRTALQAIAATQSSAGLVRIESAPFGGRPYLLAQFRDGGTERLDMSDLAAARISSSDLDAASERLLDGGAIRSADMLTEADSFYYSHHTIRELPVFRIIAADDTRYYISPTSGRLLAKFDARQRWYRWLFQGLHRFDFLAVLRWRPVWDIVMWLLLSGATAICATGTYMGWRYLSRSLRRHKASRKLPGNREPLNG